MSITDQEDALFREWRVRRPDAVPDGLADEAQYLGSKLRILFVMKEVNGTPKDFDLREFLRRADRPQTWDNVTRWLIGIRSLEEDLSWSRLTKISVPQRVEMLRSIGVMNLKKSPGSHTTDNDSLRHVAREDTDLLSRQYALYLPTLVICCGSVVAKLFDEAIEAPASRRWQTTKRGVRYRRLADDGHLIGFSHPAARAQNNLFYYGLVDAVREVLGEDQRLS